ncbi:MAG: BlaI/MecI/CopY family transcriptional regulator [Gemmatimonadaceae bacterium]
MPPRTAAAQLSNLPKRERQIIDALYQLGEATVSEVMERLPAPPSYSAVRATLRVLEDKRLVRHRVDGPRYVYLPALPADKAAGAAVRHLVQTFFAGSTEQAVMALLESGDLELNSEELDRLADRIRESRKNGR